MFLQLENIPDQLKQFTQWVAWRAVPKRNGKTDKLPINPKTGDLANHSDPSTWSTFDEALARAQLGNLDGVGFVFSKISPFVGIDLDDSIDPDKKDVRPKALEVIQKLNSYSEISPSGKGVKVFARGTLPGNGKKIPGLEMYDKSRFFTVTGNKLDGVPSTIEDRDQEVKELYRRFFPESINSVRWSSTDKAGSLSYEMLNPDRMFEKCYLLRFLKKKGEDGVSFSHDLRIALGTLSVALGDLESDEIPFIVKILGGCPDFSKEITKRPCPPSLFRK